MLETIMVWGINRCAAPVPSNLPDVQSLYTET